MKLFVGLGNPGSEHARQRHNVGFMAVERIAERHGLGPWKKRFHGLVCEGPIGGKRVMLLKPQTYMNDSGRSVGEAQRYLKIDEGDIYVFHDELDLAPGKLKVKTGGGNAGHNGLRSITATSATTMRACASASAIRAPRTWCTATCCTISPRPTQPGSSPLLDAIADAAGAAGGRRRCALPDRRGPRAEGGRGAAQGLGRAGRARSTRSPGAAPVIRPASASPSARARWPRTSRSG